MPARNSENLSAQLKDTRNRLADYRHGGIILNSDQVDAFVEKFDEFIAMARTLENGVDFVPTVDASGVISGSNVVAFPGRSPDHRPTGGTA